VPWETDTTKRNICENEGALFLYQLDCPSYTSINEVADVNVALYPNPASNQITIQTDVAMDNVTIVDRLGRMVGSYSASGNETKVNVSALSAGIYIAKNQPEIRSRKHSEDLHRGIIHTE
jgi:hypothetical protein